MEQVINAVGKIRLLPGALVDYGFRQGYDAVYKQFISLLDNGTVWHPEIYEADWEGEAKDYIAAAPEVISKLKRMASPYRLPDDYLFFLEFYGGLSIKTDIKVSNVVTRTYYFEVMGIGPMTDEWYGNVIYDNGYAGTGHKFLFISILRITPGFTETATDSTQELNNSEVVLNSDWLEFHLDVAGIVQEHSIIVEQNEGDKHNWKKVADSFTELLERVATTGGVLNWI